MQDDINDGKMLQILLDPLLSVYPIFNLNKPRKPHVGGFDQVFVGAFLYFSKLMRIKFIQ